MLLRKRRCVESKCCDSRICHGVEQGNFVFVFSPGTDFLTHAVQLYVTLILVLKDSCRSL